MLVVLDVPSTTPRSEFSLRYLAGFANFGKPLADAECVIPSTTAVASLNTFGRNEIEVAPISSALLRIACLVILYKTCRVPDQELAADGVSGPVLRLIADCLRCTGAQK